MDYTNVKERILAAQALLLEPSSSFEKFDAVRKLLAGIHPGFDKALQDCEKDIATVRQVLGNDFFTFATENLPEVTEEQKKRKKAALFFWKSWNTLRGEVSRVQTEMQAIERDPEMHEKASHTGRIFNFAKGPFGIFTLIAVAIVTASAATSVQIVIHNEGCDTMQASSGMPFPFPGVSIPTDSIPAGGSVVAALPGVPFSVDGTQQGTLAAKLLTFTLSFELGAANDVTLDGESLIGKVTNVNLLSKKTHDLVFTCK